MDESQTPAGSYWKILEYPVPAPDHVKPHSSQYCRASCRCGTERVITLSSITTGKSLSCGCRATERYRAVVIRNAPTELLIEELKRRNRRLAIQFDHTNQGGTKSCLKKPATD